VIAWHRPPARATSVTGSEVRPEGAPLEVESPPLSSFLFIPIPNENHPFAGASLATPGLITVLQQRPCSSNGLRKRSPYMALLLKCPVHWERVSCPLRMKITLWKPLKVGRGRANASKPGVFQASNHCPNRYLNAYL
jgi:hypothetical protein